MKVITEVLSSIPWSSSRQECGAVELTKIERSGHCADGKKIFFCKKVNDLHLRELKNSGGNNS